MASESRSGTIRRSPSGLSSGEAGLIPPRLSNASMTGEKPSPLCAARSSPASGTDLTRAAPLLSMNVVATALT